MPTYLYKCNNENCIGEFEQYHSIMIKLEECPHCIEFGRGSQPVERLIHGGGSGRGIVELTGQEYVKKVQEDAQKYKQEVYSSEKLYSSALGEDKYEKLQSNLDRNRR